MLNRTSGILELNTLDFLEDLSDKYYHEFNIKPFNLSDWNPSEKFKSELIAKLKIPIIGQLIDYEFSDNNENKEDLLISLGFDPMKKGCLITPTGSVSILSVLNWLKRISVKEISVYCPSYFSLFHNCLNFDIKTYKHYLIRDENGFSYPRNRINTNFCWITNPVYCTSRYIDQKKEINYLDKLMSSGIHLIVDECLATKGNELSHILGNNENYIGIYAPHKTVCINGIKFSLLVFDKSFQPFFDQWSDILYGCLSASNITAIKHYLGKNFEIYNAEFHCKITETFSFIKKICSELQGVQLDAESKGYLATIYFPKIDGNKSLDPSLLWDIVSNTGCYFIPGIRNHFDPKNGLCFRVNLTRDSPQFRSSLIRLINYLVL